MTEENDMIFKDEYKVRPMTEYIKCDCGNATHAVYKCKNELGGSFYHFVCRDCLPFFLKDKKTGLFSYVGDKT